MKLNKERRSVKVIMRKGIEKNKKDVNPFYKVIEDIRYKKDGNLLDDDVNLKAFSNFSALRFLSMDRDNIDIVNMLNQFQGVLDKKAMYEILVDIIPPKQGYIHYTSSKKSENDYVPCICEFYNCSPKEAQDYLDLKGEDWAKDILKQFGGKV